MKSLICITLAVLAAVLFSAGCLEEPPKVTLTSLSIQMDSVIENQRAILTIQETQAAKFTEILYHTNTTEREIKDLTDNIASLRHDLNSTNKYKVRVEGINEDGASGFGGQFNSIDEAIQYLNSYK